MTANPEPPACCPHCIENRTQILDENLGLRQRVAELELIAEQRYAHMKTYHNTVSGLETQLHDAWQMRAKWKQRAERWKSVAAGYRRFANILALIPYTARNRRMLMGFKRK